MYKVQKNRDHCLNRHNSSKIHLKSKEGWKIQHKFCMVLWPSKQGSLFFWGHPICTDRIKTNL